jgi:hypothetical protein
MKKDVAYISISFIPNFLNCDYFISGKIKFIEAV